jgi:hypothetical protein
MPPPGRVEHPYRDETNLGAASLWSLVYQRVQGLTLLFSVRFPCAGTVDKRHHSKGHTHTLAHSPRASPSNSCLHRQSSFLARKTPLSVLRPTLLAYPGLSSVD